MCVETNNWGEEEPAYIIDDRPVLACSKNYSNTTR